MVKKLLGMALLIMVTSCTSIVSKHPIGNLAKRADTMDFNGVWAVDDKVYMVSHAEDGTFTLGFISFNDDVKGFDVQNREGMVCNYEGIKYLNVKSDKVMDEGTEDGFFLLKYNKMDDDHVLLSFIDSVKLENLIEQGIVKGEVDSKKNLYIDVDSVEIAELAEKYDLFEKADVGLLRRIHSKVSKMIE